jgi:F420 biosynthesis protein FbiB-like protein
MLDVLDEIRKRRSIRKYQEKEVDLKIVLKALDVARWSPSAHNAQPWRYIIVEDRLLKKRLAENMAAAWIQDLKSNGYSGYQIEQLTEGSISLFSDAPVLLIACLSMEDMHQYPDDERRTSEYLMGVQSVAASIMSLLLALHSLNLGASWYCAPLFCQSIVKETLLIPKEVHPQALITLGYADESPQPPPRFNLEEIVFKTNWGMHI